MLRELKINTNIACKNKEKDYKNADRTNIISNDIKATKTKINTIKEISDRPLSGSGKQSLSSISKINYTNNTTYSIRNEAKAKSIEKISVSEFKERIKNSKSKVISRFNNNNNMQKYKTSLTRISTNDQDNIPTNFTNDITNKNIKTNTSNNNLNNKSKYDVYLPHSTKNNDSKLNIYNNCLATNTNINNKSHEKGSYLNTNFSSCSNLNKKIYNVNSQSSVLNNRIKNHYSDKILEFQTEYRAMLNKLSDVKAINYGIKAENLIITSSINEQKGIMKERSDYFKALLNNYNAINDELKELTSELKQLSIIKQECSNKACEVSCLTSVPQENRIIDLSDNKTLLNDLKNIKLKNSDLERHSKELELELKALEKEYNKSLLENNFNFEKIKKKVNKTNSELNNNFTGNYKEEDKNVENNLKNFNDNDINQDEGILISNDHYNDIDYENNDNLCQNNSNLENNKDMYAENYNENYDNLIHLNNDMDINDLAYSSNSNNIQEKN